MPLTPKNRKEEWLQGLVDHETTLTPKNRPEEWMKGLIEGSTTLTPKNRCEEWLKEIIDASGSYKLLSSYELTANVTSTSAITLETITVPGLYDVYSAKDCFIYVKIRDKAGERTDYYYGADVFLLANSRQMFTYIDDNGTMSLNTGTYGIHPDTTVSSNDSIAIKGRYSASFSKTIDGTFTIEFYTLPFNGESPLS